MKEYPHIDSVYKRDLKGKFMMGEYSTPEFKYLEDKPWTWTEKIDGTNIRLMWKPDNGMRSIFIGGKTENAQIPTKLNDWFLTHLPPRAAFYDAVGDVDVCFYGEGYGAGIQKGGGLYSAEQKFILFDVKIGNWWLLRKDVEDIANKLRLDVVPILLTPTYTLIEMIDFVSKRADNPPVSSISFDAKIEGWVGQPEVPLFNRKGERIITKIKYKDFK